MKKISRIHRVQTKVNKLIFPGFDSCTSRAASSQLKYIIRGARRRKKNSDDKPDFHGRIEGKVTHYYATMTAEQFTNYKYKVNGIKIF